MLPVSQSKELYISQLTGNNNAILLRNRALPYQKAEFLSGKQNENKAVYPGNPIATIQILGSEELPTTFTGRWSDRFVEADIYYGTQKTTVSPNDATAGLGNAKQLVIFFNTLRLEGQAVGVSWDDFYEEGILKECHFTFIRSQDIEYTLEFEWTKQDISQTQIAAGIPTTFQNIVNDIANIQSQISSFSDELISIQGYLSTITVAFETTLNGLIGSIAYATQNLIGLGTQVLNMAAATTSVYVSAVNLLQGLIIQSAQLVRQVNDIETQLLQPTGWQQTKDYLDFITGLANLKNQAGVMVNTASNYSESLNKNYVQNNDYITQYVAKDGDNLRMVSQKFYGDSSYWSYLADINFLQNSGLTSGTVVLIPKIPGSTILQYPPPLNSIAVPATVT
jgi:nucleoid-associated protein YgaU